MTASGTRAPRSLVAGPSEPELHGLLGRRYRLFERLAHLRPGVGGEWRRYKKGAPPVLKVVEGKTTLFYVRPDAGCVRVSLLIARRAARAALAGRLSPPVRATLQSAQEFPEGLAVRLTLHRLADVAQVEALLAVKLARA